MTPVTIWALHSCESSDGQAFSGSRGLRSAISRYPDRKQCRQLAASAPEYGTILSALAAREQVQQRPGAHQPQQRTRLGGRDRHLRHTACRCSDATAAYTRRGRDVKRAGTHGCQRRIANVESAGDRCETTVIHLRVPRPLSRRHHPNLHPHHHRRHRRHHMELRRRPQAVPP